MAKHLFKTVGVAPTAAVAGAGLAKNPKPRKKIGNKEDVSIGGAIKAIRNRKAQLKKALED